MTTVSVLNREVKYYETPKIEEIDIGYKTYVYELEVPELGISPPITVVLGKPQYKESKHIAYFPIYAIRRSTIRAQIGVFEVKMSLLPQIYNNEVDVTLLDRPLIYSFVTPAYLAKLEADPKLFGAELTPTPPKELVQEEPVPEEPAVTEEEEHLRLDIPEEQITETKRELEDESKKKIFEDIPGFQPKKYLPEETKEDAERNNREYKDESQNKWIERYMRNNHYNIHEVESNGDSLFAVIRNAFEDIGKSTTVEKLRKIVANEMTAAVFEDEYLKKFQSYAQHINNLQSELDEFESQMKEHKRKQKQMKDSVEESQKLMAEYEEMRKRRVHLHLKIRKLKEEQESAIGDVGKVDTLEKMQKYIQTSNYRADQWSITTLERILNIKLIMFSQTTYEPEGDKNEPKDLEGVLMCGYKSPELEQHQAFNPDYYIMVSCSGPNCEQYSLISYRERKILQFREIPYDVKIKILKRCLTSTSGFYYLIADFRDLKTKFAIDADTGAPPDYRKSPEAGELYDPDTQFMFYARSDKSRKPGFGEGEKIPSHKVAEYSALASKENTEWRKKLDDEWDKTPIVVDGHRWTSVLHYMRAVQYKDQNPDIYLMFSLDSDPNNELTTSVKEAKAFKGLVEVQEEKVTKKKKTEVKKKMVSPAPLSDERMERERKSALLAKFRDNAELGNMLKLTKDAMLLHALPKHAPEPDILLMKVRNEL